MSYRHCIYFIPCSGLQDVKFHLYGAVLLCRTSYHTFCDPFFESPYSPAPGTTWTLYSGINWKSSCTWRKQHGICLSFFGGEFLASWCTSDEAHRDNNSYLFLVLKNRKEFFSKREKKKKRERDIWNKLCRFIIGSQARKKNIQPSLRNQLGFILQTTFRKR